MTRADFTQPDLTFTTHKYFNVEHDHDHDEGCSDRSGQLKEPNRFPQMVSLFGFLAGFATCTLPDRCLISGP